MSRHDYPPGSLIGDYCRAGIGLALVAVPLLAVRLNPAVTAILGVLAALFLVFAARTVLRQLEEVEISESGIARLGPFPKRIAWSALEGMKLAYYATRRDGGNGWMQLALSGGGRGVTIDSRITGFAEIAARAARAAAERGLALAPSTAANLAALGIAHPVPQ